MKNELVIVVPREKLFGKNNEKLFEGFRAVDETDWSEIIKENYTFMPREEAENNENFLQVIAFIVVKKKDKLFITHKLSGTGDKREVGLYSIAVGGHINPIDGNALHKGAEREFFEEVNYKGKFNGKLIGFVNSETDVFNKVHFGAVFLQEVDSDIDINEEEKNIMAGEFMTVPQIRKIYTKLGFWSQAIFDKIGIFL